MPFTRAEFFSVFEAYSLAIWPAQVVAYFVAFIALSAVLVRGRWTGAIVTCSLALLWAWIGAFYFIGYFSAINSAAYVFGALFIAQAFTACRQTQKPDGSSCCASTSKSVTRGVLSRNWRHDHSSTRPLLCGVRPQKIPCYRRFSRQHGRR